MPNRLAGAVSPYLRSHAMNPVDWQQWGEEPFAEAQRRNVPVLISIGYSTCHWCHVMARETFSDPELAAYLNARFVSIKVDREEYPDVDSAYLAAAGAFTEQLGWPLTIFATPAGKTFYAGTYFPPQPLPGRASFRQVLDAVLDAWSDRRDEVESDADEIASALAAQAARAPGALPTGPDFAAIIRGLADYEDREFGGFGGAPKFPVATVLLFLLDREAAGDLTAGEVARRALNAMADSELRDPVEGGFFRYATRRNWTEPHYERMLYDNALLLAAYARIGRTDVADGIASFLMSILRLPSGAFASAQDSESTVDGVRVEGGYYALDADGRSRQRPPELDDKVLTGWNGLAIGALASAGVMLGRADWIHVARAAADVVGFGHIVRARIGGSGSTGDVADGGRMSPAQPTLEDYGMLASGLVEVALATGESRYAVRALTLIQELIRGADGAAGEPSAAGAEEAGAGGAGGSAAGAVAGRESMAAEPVGIPFVVPGGSDPVLAARGLALAVDPSEGAYPSGLSAAANAAHTLYLLTGDAGLLAAAVRAMELLAPAAVQRPISFGAALGVMSALDAPVRQLVVVTDDVEAPAPPDTATDSSGRDIRCDIHSVARSVKRSGGLLAEVASAQSRDFAAAGFDLFDGRSSRGGTPTAYYCEDFLCRLPVTAAEDLAKLLPSRESGD